MGVIGLLDHPRKGKDLVDHLRRLPFVQILTTEGRVPENQLRDFYQRVDYVLIPATVEGGPMSLLEGLGLGKPVIAPEGVGMVQEFAECKYIRNYPKGHAAALEQVVRICFAEKLECCRLVNGRTWDDWAESHHRLFMNLMKSRGIPLPTPAPGFRFGMMKELDLPWDIDIEPLETAVDRAAGHLFFGRYSEARDILAEASTAYPCLHTLLETIPEHDEMPIRLSECSSAVPIEMQAAHQGIRPPEELPPTCATGGCLGPPVASEPTEHWRANTHASGTQFSDRNDAAPLPEYVAESFDSRTKAFVPRSAEPLQPRILLIAHVGTLRDRLDKSHFYRYEALCRRPGVKLFGPGLPGYRNEMSIDEAIQTAFGKLRPDLIIHGGDFSPARTVIFRTTIGVIARCSCHFVR